MSLPKHPSSPLDPNLWTGPSRFNGPPIRIGAVTEDLPYGANGAAEYATWLYVGGAGNVTIIDWRGNAIQMIAPTVGVWHWVGSTMVTSATTATNLLWGS